MSLSLDFSSRFIRPKAFEETSIKAGSNLQTTRAELQEATSEIDTLKGLIDENYKHALNCVMDIMNLTAELNDKSPFKCIPFPKNRDTITYAEKSGYIQYTSAFLKYVGETMTEQYLERDGHLMSLTKMVAQSTINEPVVTRTGAIKLPDMSDEPEKISYKEPDIKVREAALPTPPSSARTTPTKDATAKKSAK